MQKKIKQLVASLFLCLLVSFPSYAGEWKQDDIGWYYINDDGAILTTIITPDGYWVGDDGYWISDSGIDEAAMAERSLTETIIVFNKTSHQLQLWDQGQKIYSCLGTAGALKGDKEVEGDWKTPIGEFYVCVKNANSQYHKSLGLSYPYLDDAERGLAQNLITSEQYKKIMRALQNGKQPDWYTPLGGEIMIHGNRLETDMTRGCICILDSDIDIIWNYVKVGTRIIVQE